MRDLLRYINGKQVRSWRKNLAEHIEAAEHIVPQLDDELAKKHFRQSLKIIDEKMWKYRRHFRLGGEHRLEWLREMHARVDGLKAVAILFNI